MKQVHWAMTVAQMLASRKQFLRVGRARLEGGHYHLTPGSPTVDSISL